MKLLTVQIPQDEAADFALWIGRRALAKASDAAGALSSMDKTAQFLEGDISAQEVIDASGDKNMVNVATRETPSINQVCDAVNLLCDAVNTGKRIQHPLVLSDIVAMIAVGSRK